MATSSGVLCEVCDAQHITKSAEYWCPECEEGFCSDCQSYHFVSKASRNHEVIPVESYKKLPPSVSKIVQYCTDHDLKYTTFCQHHNSLCCPVCISTSHTDCYGGRMISVEELIKASKTSAMLENIEQCCKDLKCNLDKIKEDRKQNFTKVKEQRQMIQTEIQQLRVKINTHLDKLEEDIITQLLAAENAIKLRIEDLLTKLSAESLNVDVLHSNILAVIEYASDIQTFYSCKTIEAEVEKAEKFIRSLFEDGSLQHLKLTCHLNGNISQIVSAITTFGIVSTDTSLPCIDMRTERDKQAQITAVTQQPTKKSIKDITLTLHSTINIPKQGKTENNITGVTVRPDRKMAFTDGGNGRLVILNVDGTVDKEISTRHILRDVTSIDDKCLAVTTDGEILIINTESKQTEKTVKTFCSAFGITHHKGAIMWCEAAIGIKMCKLTNKKSTTVVKQHELGGWSYLTTCGERIYQTNYFDYTISCFTTKGDKLWEYKDESIMEGATGIAVDNDYNVYITSCPYNSLIVLSPDGKQIRTLLGHEDGIQCPCVLHYDLTKNMLLVCTEGGRVFRYNVSS